jgi:hypothetical protein
VTRELVAKDLDELTTLERIAIAAAMREVTAAVDTREVVGDSLAAEADSEAAEVAAKRVRVNFWGRSRLRKPCGPWFSMKSGRKASSIPRPHVCLPTDLT